MKDSKFELEEDVFTESMLTESFSELETSTEVIVEAEELTVVEDEGTIATKDESLPENSSGTVEQPSRVQDDFVEVNPEPSKKLFGFFNKKKNIEKPNNINNQKQPTKKESGKKSNTPIIIGAVFVVGILGFIFWMVMSVYSEMTQETSLTTQAQPAQVVLEEQVVTPSDGQNNTASSFVADDKSKNGLAEQYASSQKQVEPEANAYGVPPVDTAVDGDSEVIEHTGEEEPMASTEQEKPILYGEPDEKAPVTAVESEMMGISSKNGTFDSNAGGVCDLSVKFKPDSYIYYILEGETYVPIFKKADWDGKGIQIDTRVVTLSYDNINKFTEIEKGKFIPSEMFSKCSAFEKK